MAALSHAANSNLSPALHDTTDLDLNVPNFGSGTDDGTSHQGWENMFGEV